MCRYSVTLFCTARLIIGHNTTQNVSWSMLHRKKRQAACKTCSTIAVHWQTTTRYQTRQRHRTCSVWMWLSVGISVRGCQCLAAAASETAINQSINQSMNEWWAKSHERNSGNITFTTLTSWSCRRKEMSLTTMMTRKIDERTRQHTTYSLSHCALSTDVSSAAAWLSATTCAHTRVYKKFCVQIITSVTFTSCST